MGRIALSIESARPEFLARIDALVVEQGGAASRESVAVSLIESALDALSVKVKGKSKSEPAPEP